MAPETVRALSGERYGFYNISIWQGQTLQLVDWSLRGCNFAKQLWTADQSISDHESVRVCILGKGQGVYTIGLLDPMSFETIAFFKANLLAEPGPYVSS